MPQHVANHPSLPAVTGLPDGYTVTISGVLYRVESGVWITEASGEGFDGRQVQLRASATHLQWRYEGDPAWLDLFALADVQGDPGDPGDPGVGVPPGGLTGQMLVKTADADFLTEWADPPEGTIGGTARDGREVELQVSATHIQWRYVGEAWANLVALEELRGPAGAGGTGGGGAGIAFRGDWVGTGAEGGTTVDLSGAMPSSLTVSATGTMVAETVDVTGVAGITRAVTLSGVGANNGGVVSITLVATTPAGEVRFWDRVSSEGGYDYGRFELDGSQLHSIAGTHPWQERTFAVTAGEHTLRWRYTKDSSGSVGDDAYFVAKIQLPAAGGGGYTAGDVVHHTDFSWLAVRATTTEPVQGGMDWVPLGALTAGTGGSSLPPGGDPGQVLTRVGIDGAYWADTAAPPSSGGSNLADAFRGVWAEGIDFARGDLVRHENDLWVASVDIPSAVERLRFLGQSHAFAFPNYEGDKVLPAPGEARAGDLQTLYITSGVMYADPAVAQEIITAATQGWTQLSSVRVDDMWMHAFWRTAPQDPGYTANFSGFNPYYSVLMRTWRGAASIVHHGNTLYSDARNLAELTGLTAEMVERVWMVYRDGPPESSQIPSDMSNRFVQSSGSYYFLAVGDDPVAEGQAPARTSTLTARDSYPESLGAMTFRLEEVQLGGFDTAKWTLVLKGVA